MANPVFIGSVKKPEKTKGNLLFYHGGNLESLREFQSYRSNRQKYGTGLYLTSNYDVAKRYAKGNRKLYLVSVERGNDIENSFVTLSKLSDFMNSYFGKPATKKVLQFLSDRVENGRIPLFFVNNVLINSELIKPRNSGAWQEFLIQNGADYEIVENAFGYNDKMMVLYNIEKISSIKRIESSDKIPYRDTILKS